MAIIEDGGVDSAAQAEIIPLRHDMRTRRLDRRSANPMYPEHTLPFVAATIGSGCGLWGTPRPDYSDGWADGEARAIVLLNTLFRAGHRDNLSLVLRNLAINQVEAGFPTAATRAPSLDFGRLSRGLSFRW
jgi:hypothetical protein